MNGPAPAVAREPVPDLSVRLLRASKVLLGGTAWSSCLLFGLYIWVFYAGALLDGDMTRWNGVLPGLYVPDRAAATAGIGVHFLAGGQC